MITGTVAGTSSSFTILTIPGTNVVPLQSGPVVRSDDPLVTVSTDPTGDPFKFVAAVDKSDAAPTYNLVISGVNGAGNPVTHTFLVPITPVPPPPPTQILDFDLNQTS